MPDNTRKTGDVNYWTSVEARSFYRQLATTPNSVAWTSEFGAFEDIACVATRTALNPLNVVRIVLAEWQSLTDYQNADSWMDCLG